MRDKIRNSVDRVLSWFLIVLMASAVINVLWGVITRWILKDPSAYTEELARYLLIWIGVLGAGYAAGKKMHLAIDLLPSRLEGTARHVIEIAIELFIFAFAVSVMFVGGYHLMSLTLLMGQRSASLGVQLGWVYSVIPLSGAVIAFYAVISVLERVQLLRGRPIEVEEHERKTQKPID